MAYKTYKVQSGDSLSKIAKKLNLGSWQELYNLNRKIIGSNYNRIYPGQTLSIPGTQTTAKPAPAKPAPVQPAPVKTTTTPSQEIVKTIAEPIDTTTRETFLENYGTQEALRPDAMFHAFAEERVNPEQMRIMSDAMATYDRRFNLMGGYASAGLQAERASYLAALERARKEEINKFIKDQEAQFNNWYLQELDRYMKSEAPTDFQLGKFGVELPSTVKEYNPTTKYTYTPAVNGMDIFKYGGYSSPISLYNVPTPISS